MVFGIYDTVVAFDHLRHTLTVLAHDDAAMPGAASRMIDRVFAALDAPLPAFARPSTSETEIRANGTPEEYMARVTRARELIADGDCIQIVLAQRFDVTPAPDPLALYRALRHVNPSPYMFCMKFDGRFALVGSSPEVHVRAINGRIEIRPIAGTRRRGANPEEDEANADELLADPKERAEHLMLVDLARNDVGRASEFGSVRVTDFMTIERYSHVMHIVSNVEGRLRPDRTAYDVMRATFPAGTVSGSPKVRALQIINGCEVNKRGVYAGAVGYFGFDGNSDSCIALRTIVLKDGKAYVQAGAGVVADSTPEGEYQETVNKAMGMMSAIARAKAINI